MFLFVFDSQEQIHPDVASYDSLIAAATSCGQRDQANVDTCYLSKSKPLIVKFY